MIKLQSQIIFYKECTALSWHFFVQNRALQGSAMNSVSVMNFEFNSIWSRFHNRCRFTFHRTSSNFVFGLIENSLSIEFFQKKFFKFNSLKHLKHINRTFSSNFAVSCQNNFPARQIPISIFSPQDGTSVTYVKQLLMNNVECVNTSIFWYCTR